MTEPICARTAECVGFDRLTVDLGGRTLFDSEGRDIALTCSEFELLVAFEDGSPGQLARAAGILGRLRARLRLGFLELAFEFGLLAVELGSIFR